MTNLKEPVFLKNKYKILEMIVLILRANPGVKLTPIEVNKFFVEHPNVEKHLNRRNAQDPVSSIMWCYQDHHNKQGESPELDFDGKHFYLVDYGKISNSKNRNQYVEEASNYRNGNHFSNSVIGKNTSKVGTTRTSMNVRGTQFNHNTEKNYIQPKRANSGINNNSDDEELPKGMLKLILGFMGIALVIALFFNVLGIREIIMKLAVIGGLGFLGYKIINAKNTGFNLAGRLVILIAIILAVYGSMFR